MRLVTVGGSDAGISAALRARELDADAEVTVVVADGYPNFSICGIPYYVAGDVADWRNLAHRSLADLDAAGITLRLNTTARRIDAAAHKVLITDPAGREELLGYDALVVATGATPVRPPIDGLVGDKALGAVDGVHLLHTMADTFAVMGTLERSAGGRAVIVGAGYVGLEMAEAFVARGLQVTQFEQLPEVLPTVDADLGALVRAELVEHGVDVLTATTVTRIRRTDTAGPLRIEAGTSDGATLHRDADVVLVSVGVRPDADVAAAAGATLGVRGAIAVDRGMRTDLPEVFAAGDCAVTYHRLLGDSYLPLGTTAHKQGAVAGENAVGGDRLFAGSVGTQVVKVFDHVVARTGLRDHEAATAVGYTPLTVASTADDHKAYYPDAHPIHMRYTGDRVTGRLLGLQLFGHRNSEIAKRVDIAAAAIHYAMTVDAVSDLDLSYSPPFGSPWDAVQTGAQAWVAAVGPDTRTITRNHPLPTDTKLEVQP